MQVLTIIDTGGFAQEAVAHESACVKLPQDIDLQQAAGLPVAFGTAYLALVHRARLRKGQTVLVLGAGGGVGTAAVQACMFSCTWILQIEACVGRRLFVCWHMCASMC